MFDELVAGALHATDARAVARWARVEAAACARRLSAMVAVLDRCHAADGSANREQWCIDNWAAVCAQIAAAEQITSGSASHQLLIATALRDRLPRVAALFAEGALSYRVVSAIVWRTALIKDPSALEAVDAAVANAAREWGPMSAKKMELAIDFWVDRFDPDALRRSQTGARSRCFDIGSEDASGMAQLWGTLFAHDAKALDQRIDSIAGSVCDRDGRTLDQRRADAGGALANGLDRLACRCGSKDCLPPKPSGSLVIHLVANAEDVATDDGVLDGAEPRVTPDGPLRQMTLEEALRQPPSTGPAPQGPGVLMGGALVPSGVLGRMSCGAQIRTIVHPGQAPPEPRYAPSRALAEFVRCRDLTCRFPGCDHPADASDIDHTIAYPVGPTQASNLKCLCREHHLLKSFWGGSGGWRDRQLTDGTVVWTSPDGQTYITRPGSLLLFPRLCVPTAAVAKPNTVVQSAAGLTMPRRSTTRARERGRRIDDERQLNREEPLPRSSDLRVSRVTTHPSL
jgi:hypothetical protein